MMNSMNFDLQLFATTTVPVALVRKAWGKDLWTASKNNIYFAKFTGKTADSIIHEQEDLKKEAGDQITIPLLMKLQGDGVTDDAKLEGNEEAMQYYDFSVKVHQHRHAVAIKGKFEEQKTKLNMRTNAKTGLKTWLEEKIDRMIFTALTKNPTPGRILYGGTVAAEAAITTGDVFSTEIIGKAKRIAQMSNPAIRPVKVNGTSHWVMVIDPYQTRDLKNDPKWISAQESANIRGEKNPIFSGALGMWDNVVIHEAENSIRTATGASGTMVGHSLFLGAQAAALAVAQETNWEEKVFDYGNQFGVAIDTIFGIEKSVFNGVDFAVVQAITSSVAD